MPSTTSALSYVRDLYPWLAQLGVTDEDLFRIGAADLTPEGTIAEVRKLPAYKAATVGITDDSGRMRFSEKEFFDRKDQYRQVLKTYGRKNYEYNDPTDFKALFDNEVAPQDLEQRFQVYDQVVRGSDDLREAFYVYAGIQLSDDDLYSVAVNPDAQKRYADEYNAAVATSPLDYNTWVQRATQAGLDRVVRRLTDLRSTGAVTDAAIDRVRQIDPTFAQQMVTALHAGTTGGAYLQLPELMRSLEYALIGGAALDAGMTLPDASRIEEFRQAGINRQRALEGYDQIANQQGVLSGALRRSNLGSGFSQSDLEDAVFLNKAHQSELLRRAQSFEQSLGTGGGGPRAGLGRDTGLIEQRGLYSQ